jgi:hypothetical protein
LDTDNDGLDNAADPDDDNDGIRDEFDAMPLDTDNDGLKNDVDDNDDNVGYSDALEILIGTDPLDPHDSPAGMPVSAVPLLVVTIVIGTGLVVKRRARAIRLL